MNYASFKDAFTTTTSKIIAYAIPDTPTIAAIAGAAGWAANRYYDTFGRGVVANSTIKTTQTAFKELTRPLFGLFTTKTTAETAAEFSATVLKPIFALLPMKFVPETAPIAAKSAGIGATIATSATLNFLSRNFFKPKISKASIEEFAENLRKINWPFTEDSDDLNVLSEETEPKVQQIDEKPIVLEESEKNKTAEPVVA